MVVLQRSSAAALLLALSLLANEPSVSAAEAQQFTDPQPQSHLRVPKDRELLIGGANVVANPEANYYAIPWFVELVPQNSNGGNQRRCGGVMISGDTCITVASCLYDSSGQLADPSSSQAWIKRTKDYATGAGINRQWKIVRPHPKYTYPNRDNNIALIKFNQGSLFPQRAVGSLNGDPSAPGPGALVQIMGYGDPAGGPTSILQNATFPVGEEGVNNCNTGNKEQFVCIERPIFGPNGKYNTNSSGQVRVAVTDLCPGDEGAPMWTPDNVLYGLYTGFGGDCTGALNGDAIFVRVSAFRGFILDTACEISNALCAKSCFGAPAMQAVRGFIGTVRNKTIAIWQGFVGG